VATPWRDEHIISGDYVLVERTRTARQGEIVVALVHGAETTLKRFYAEGVIVRLQAGQYRDGPHLRSGCSGCHSGPPCLECLRKSPRLSNESFSSRW